MTAVIDHPTAGRRITYTVVERRQHGSMEDTIKTKPPQPDARAKEILKSLRDARKEAVKSARMHGVPVIYMRAGKIVRERP